MVGASALRKRLYENQYALIQLMSMFNWRSRVDAASARAPYST